MTRLTLTAEEAKKYEEELREDGFVFEDGAWHNPLETPRNSALDVQVGGGHYKKWNIQPVEFCHANKIPFLEGNIVKYAIRHKDKHGIEDLRKAKHYLDLLAELEYGEEL